MEDPHQVKELARPYASMYSRMKQVIFVEDSI